MKDLIASDEATIEALTARLKQQPFQGLHEALG